VLASGVVARSSWGLSNQWAWEGGPAVCLCPEPFPCAPSSHYGELFWAASSPVSVGDPWSVGHLWSYVGRSAVPLEVGRRVAPVRCWCLFDLGVRPYVAAMMTPMPGEAAWVMDHCGQPPGSVRVSFSLHGRGWEDAQLWRAGLWYLGA
jgi:hypothetical protein